MFKNLMSGKGCLFFLYEITAFLANIASVIGIFAGPDKISFPRELGGPPIVWTESSWLSGFLLVYGLSGFSAFLWVFVKDRLIGTFKAHSSVVIMYLLFALLLIAYYGDFFHQNHGPSFILSKETIGLFIVTPLVVGRVVAEIFTAPSQP